MVKSNVRCPHCGGSIFVEDGDCLMCVRHPDLAYRDCPHCPRRKAVRRPKTHDTHGQAVSAASRVQLAYNPCREPIPSRGAGEQSGLNTRDEVVRCTEARLAFEGRGSTENAPQCVY